MRELLWRWQAVTYQQAMTASMIIAGIYNSHRTKASDRVFSWLDFHPDHVQTKAPAAGKQRVAETLSWYGGDEITWLDGYGPGVLNGK